MGGGRLISPLLVAGLVTMAALMAGPSGASAATTLGETFTPPAAPSCSNGFTRLQGTSPQDQYSAPSDGVITAWSMQGGSNPPRLRFKVARPIVGNSFMVVGESDGKTPSANELNTYTDVRIPVRSGDVIGFYLVDTAPCFRDVAGYQENIRFGDIAPGIQASFDVDLPNDNQLNVSAVLEPDCDSDGFGDETQDPDTSSCSPAPPGTPPPDNGTLPGMPPEEGGPSNDFSFGKVKKNKRKGTAKLTVNVPGGGELELAKTKKVKPDDESVENAGKDKLSIKPKGKAKKKLNAKGKAKVKANVTYTPEGGTPKTEDKKIKLLKR